MIGFSTNVDSRIIASFGNNSCKTPQQVSFSIVKGHILPLSRERCHCLSIYFFKSPVVITLEIQKLKSHVKYKELKTEKKICSDFHSTIIYIENQKTPNK